MNDLNRIMYAIENIDWNSKEARRLMKHLNPVKKQGRLEYIKNRSKSRMVKIQLIISRWKGRRWRRKQ